MADKVYVFGNVREITGKPLRAPTIAVGAARAVNGVITDDPANVIYARTAACSTDVNGDFVVEVVWVAGAIYRIEVEGVVGHLYCDMYAPGRVPFLAIKDVPGGDASVDVVTLTDALAEIDGKVATAAAAGLPVAVSDYLAANPPPIGPEGPEGPPGPAVSDAQTAAWINTGALTGAAGDARWQSGVKFDSWLVANGYALSATMSPTKAHWDAFLTAIRALGVPAIFDGKRTYVVPAPGSLNLGGTRLLGNGCTFKMADATATNLTIFQPASRFELRDCTIDINYGGRTGGAIAATASNGIGIYYYVGAGLPADSDPSRIENVTFVNSQGGSAIRIGAGQPAARAAGQENAGLSDPRDCKYVPTIIRNVRATGTGCGVYISWASGITTDGLHAGGGPLSWGGYFELGSSGNTLRRVRIGTPQSGQNLDGTLVADAAGVCTANGITSTHSHAFSVSDARVYGVDGHGIAIGGGTAGVAHTTKTVMTDIVAVACGLMGVTVDITPTPAVDYSLTWDGACDGAVLERNGRLNTNCDGFNVGTARSGTIRGLVTKGIAQAGLGLFGDDFVASLISTGDKYAVSLSGTVTYQRGGHVVIVRAKNPTTAILDAGYYGCLNTSIRGLAGSGAPSFAAPPGTEWTDTDTGDKWTRIGGNDGFTTGWQAGAGYWKKASLV